MTFDTDAALLTFGAAAIGYVAKLVFGRGIVGRMDALETEQKLQGARLEDHNARLALGNQSFQHLREREADLRADVVQLRKDLSHG